MRRILIIGFATLIAAPLSAKEVWILRADFWGNPAFYTLALDRHNNRLSGDIDGDNVSGRTTGTQFAIDATDSEGNISRYIGTIAEDRMQGVIDAPDSNDAKARAKHAFTAWKLPKRPDGAPRAIDFRPTDFSNTWNADRAPVMVVWPGDSVHTTTVDSGGVDEHGVTRALFGNPQTGPFFIAGAESGDTLAVRINRLKLNRDYADSLDTVVARALGNSLVAGADTLGKPVRWKLDLVAGRARPEGATGALAGYSVPVKPMLGGIAVAPGFGSPPISTGDTGRFGGNMDFNEVIEGNIVYLPVQQPGALLYIGDAHALQGDGETSQYALETSMDVTFSVELIKGQSIGTPRVESPAQIMVLGQAGSLDDALKSASTGMIQWLQQDYGMTLSQAAQVLGTAMQYSIPNLAGRSVGVAAKIDKRVLPPSKAVVSLK